VGAQHVGVRLEGVDAEGFEDLGRLGGNPEAAQSVERGERTDQFGFVVGVLVVAVRGVDGDPASFLVGVPLLRLGEVRVDLERERCCGGEHLEEERQSRAELLHRRCAELGLGCGGEDVGQRLGLRRRAGFLCAGDAGGRAGVGAHPQFGLRFAGGLGAEEFRDGGHGTPGIGAHGVGEAVHGGSFRSGPWVDGRPGRTSVGTGQSAGGAVAARER
jgi:hypothetical protein